MTETSIDYAEWAEHQTEAMGLEVGDRLEVEAVPHCDEHEQDLLASGHCSAEEARWKAAWITVETDDPAIRNLCDDCLSDLHGAGRVKGKPRALVSSTPYDDAAHGVFRVR
jgi:hypothetical protein